MTARKEAYPLQKVTLNLREGDWEWLRQMHGSLGAGKVIRELVMGHRARTENRITTQPLNLRDVLDVLEVQT